jgi:Rieske Fe-S protein
MKENRGFSPARRRLLQQFLMMVGAISMTGLLAGLLRRVQVQQVPEAFPLPADLPEGLSVAGDVIVHRDASGRLHAYSSRCTHLGCRIDRILDGEAACPCHGSRFRADGTVARGPAVRPLVPATLEPDKATGGWIARVPS